MTSEARLQPTAGDGVAFGPRTAHTVSATDLAANDGANADFESFGPPSITVGAAADPTPVVTTQFVRFTGAESRVIDDGLIAEIRLAIHVDGRELVQLMCSPHQLSALVVGFLSLEGAIEGYDDIESIRICAADRIAEVRLACPMRELPSRRIVTSGCTGGLSFGAYLDDMESLRLPADVVRVEAGCLYRLLRELYDRADLYRRSGGVHTSLLADVSAHVLAVAEDIGRHNTIDKLRGLALLRGFAARGGIIVASGRISSEMLLKAAIMGVPVVASRTSPTQLAVELGERLGITVVGYLRSASMNVYTHPHRIVGEGTA